MTLDLTSVRFGGGSHPSVSNPTGDRDMCIMEAVAFFAGESWGASPACACPVISEFLRSWNDDLSDDDRDRLLPADVWVPRLVGSRGNEAIEKRRTYLILDWVIRVYIPTWFDLVPSLAPQVAALRALSEIIDVPTAQSARMLLVDVRDIAGRAMYADAQDIGYAEMERAHAAAHAAAWNAALDAVECTTWNVVVCATRGTARGTARVTKEVFAQAFAANPEQNRTQSTVHTLQQSALDLLDRMLACKDTDGPPHTNK